jgi:hypothetical protein
LGVSSAHFGTQNNKQLVRTDETIQLIRNGWYRNVEWKWYNEDGIERDDMGVYLVTTIGQNSSAHLNMSQQHQGMAISFRKLRLLKKMWSEYSV